MELNCFCLSCSLYNKYHKVASQSYADERLFGNTESEYHVITIQYFVILTFEPPRGKTNNVDVEEPIDPGAPCRGFL